VLRSAGRVTARSREGYGSRPITIGVPGPASALVFPHRGGRIPSPTPDRDPPTADNPTLPAPTRGPILATSRPAVAGFEVFLSGRFSVFGDTRGAQQCVWFSLQFALPCFF
jgi:hypothetical protein